MNINPLLDIFKNEIIRANISTLGAGNVRVGMIDLPMAQLGHTYVALSYGGDIDNQVYGGCGFLRFWRLSIQVYRIYEDGVVNDNSRVSNDLIDLSTLLTRIITKLYTNAHCGEWDATTAYVIGNVVYVSAGTSGSTRQYYIATAGNINEDPEGTGGVWDIIEDWGLTATYNTDDYVQIDGDLFQALSNNLITNPLSDTAGWREIYDEWYMAQPVQYISQVSPRVMTINNRNSWVITQSYSVANQLETFGTLKDL